MKKSIGKCTCGQTSVIVNLPLALDQYSPRECDCDFCIANNIAYLSDPNGALYIQSKVPLEIQRQGSNEAGFITCTKCKDILATSLQLENRLIGALNSRLLLDSSLLQKATTISPKELDVAEKINRWKTLWLNIKVNGNSFVYNRL